MRETRVALTREKAVVLERFELEIRVRAVRCLNSLESRRLSSLRGVTDDIVLSLTLVRMRRM
jgi:hypothetical protein